MNDTLQGPRRVVQEATEAVRAEADAYRLGEDRPLESFAAVMGTYAGVVTLGAIAARRQFARAAAQQRS